MKSSGGGKKIAIFSPNHDELSETFIKAHIEGLPFEIFPIYGRGRRRTGRNGLKLLPVSRRVIALTTDFMPNTNERLLSFFLARYLKKNKVDAVLAEYGTTGALLVDVCRMAKKPLFVHFHGFDASIEGWLQFYKEQYKRMFAFASGIVAVSDAMYRKLLELGAPEDRLYLNRCGVDPKKFHGGSPEKSPPVFAAVGRFAEKKAPHLTLLAFCRVVENCPGARLVMVGGGPLLGPVRRMVDALGIADKVELRGKQPPQAVSRLLKESRAFVQHSLVAENGDSEGTPLGVIEAQMTGLPVVSTYHAGIPDVVVNGETGFLVPEGAVDEMGERMLQLANDSVLAGQMGRAGIERALAHFTLERHLGELAQMIEEGIARHKGMKN